MRTVLAILAGAALVAAIGVGGAGATAAKKISGTTIKNHSIALVKLTVGAQKALRTGEPGPDGSDWAAGTRRAAGTGRCARPGGAAGASRRLHLRAHRR